MTGQIIQALKDRRDILTCMIEVSAQNRLQSACD